MDREGTPGEFDGLQPACWTLGLDGALAVLDFEFCRLPGTCRRNSPGDDIRWFPISNIILIKVCFAKTKYVLTDFLFLLIKIAKKYFVAFKKYSLNSDNDLVNFFVENAFSDVDVTCLWLSFSSSRLSLPNSAFELYDPELSELCDPNVSPLFEFELFSDALVGIFGCRYALTDILFARKLLFGLSLP